MALLINAIVAVFLPPLFSARKQPRAHITRVDVAHATPTPQPSPTPTPQPSIAPPRIGRRSGISAPPARHKRNAAPQYRPSPQPSATPIPAAAARPAGTGAGSKSGAGSPGTGASGNGSGQAGTGSGAGGSVPCGYVTFENIPGPQRRAPDGAFLERILMSVHFPDGKAASLRLDYRWRYPDAAGDPWSAQNKARTYPVTMQRPPAHLLANEPPLMQYVIAHTTPDGITMLLPCASSP